MAMSEILCPECKKNSLRIDYYRKCRRCDTCAWYRTRGRTVHRCGKRKEGNVMSRVLRTRYYCNLCGFIKEE